MVESPGFGPPGNTPLPAEIEISNKAIWVAGKLGCPNHPGKRVRTEVPGVLYRCATEHDLAPPDDRA